MLNKILCRRNQGGVITWVLFFSLIFLLSGPATVQAGPEDPFSLTLSVPECKIISSDNSTVTYKLEKTVDPEKAYFRWDFSNGMDRTLEQNLFEVSLFNVDDNVEVKLNRGQPADFQNFNGTTIEAGVFKYTKMGRNPDPKIRRVEMTLSSNVLEPSKNYILTVGPKFEANNGNTLNKTYSWQFATSEFGTVSVMAKQPDPDASAIDTNGEVNPNKGSNEKPSAGGSGDGSGGGQGEPLELVSSTPRNGESGVTPDTEIRLTFSKNVINMTVKDANRKCFSLWADNEPVEIEVLVADDQVEPELKRDVVLVPVDSLQPDKTYTVKVAPEFQAKNGAVLDKELKVSFSTGNVMESSKVNIVSSNEKTETAPPSADDKRHSSIPVIILAIIIGAGISGYAYVQYRKRGK